MNSIYGNNDKEERARVALNSDVERIVAIQGVLNAEKHVILSEAKQSSLMLWIAASLTLLAMTTSRSFHAQPNTFLPPPRNDDTFTPSPEGGGFSVGRRRSLARKVEES